MAIEDPRRMEKTEKSDRPYADLCYAVVIQACRDYYHALCRQKGHLYHSTGKRHRDQYGRFVNEDYMINDCETFFLEEISLYSDLDGAWIMQKIRERVDGR